MKLTDEDRAAKAAIWQRALLGEFASTDIDEAIYIAGLRAGMERAAVLCESAGIRSYGAALARAIRGCIKE